MENQPTDQQLAIAMAALAESQSTALALAKEACTYPITDVADAALRLQIHQINLGRIKELFGADHPVYLDTSDKAVAYFMDFAAAATKSSDKEHSVQVAEMARKLADFDMSDAGRMRYADGMRLIESMARFESKTFRSVTSFFNKG